MEQGQTMMLNEGSDKGADVDVDDNDAYEVRGRACSRCLLCRSFPTSV
jgi:hypothetical protein